MLPKTLSLRCLALGAALCLLIACHDHTAPGVPVAQQPFEMLELAAGAGPSITAGQTAGVEYRGWLFDADAPEHKGRLFDSSQSGGAPLHFTLGAGQVIKGWDTGIAGMKLHGRRRLVIPPDLAYGERGAGSVIPPGATLVFDVELVSIE